MELEGNESNIGDGRLKQCCHCRQVKPLTCFYKNHCTKDGFHRECKICKNKYYTSNKDKLFPKITCSCGKSVYKYYFEKHLMTKYHKSL